MIANRVLNVIFSLLCPFLLPCRIVSTFSLGLLAGCTLGLLLIPLTLVWWFLFFPTLWLSWLSSRIPRAREVIGFLFIPWVLIGLCYSVLMPCMGEYERHSLFLMLFNSWPFTWEFHQFASGRGSAEADRDVLTVIISRMTRHNPLWSRVIEKIVNGLELD